MILRITSLVLLLSLVAFTPSIANSQSAATYSDLITLAVTVKNKRGNLVAGVPRESFEILDDKEARPIESFANEDSPVSIGLLVDTSGSMQFYENKDIARAAAIGDALSHFVEMSNPKSEFFVLAFDSTPRNLTDWKIGDELSSQKISISPQKKDTALYDAIIMGLDKFASAHYSRHVLILFTDGQDNNSKSTFMQVRERLKKSDISLYAIGIMTPSDVGSALGMEGEGILDELTAVSGGESLYPHDKKEMAGAIDAVASELRHQYRISFLAPRTKTDWHRVRIKVTPRVNAPTEFKSLSARTRQGYYSQ